MKQWWEKNKTSRSKETINKIKESKRNNPQIMTKERIQKHIDSSSTKKPVVQFTLEGVKIKEYTSINEASRQTGIGNDCISACVRGKQNTSGGYIWKYKFNLEGYK